MSQESGSVSKANAAAGAGGEAQKPAQKPDCLGCRLTGGMFGVVGGAYMASTLLHTPAPVGMHRFGIIAAAGSMFAFGMARAFFL